MPSKPPRQQGTTTRAQPLPIGQAMLPEARPVRTPGVRRLRMSPKLKAALEIMAYQGLPVKYAAPEAGMTVESLTKAMNRPHVKAAYSQLVSEIRSNSAQEAFLRMNHLSITAESENVRKEANAWVAGVGDIAPIRRMDSRVNHNVTFGGFVFAAPGQVIEHETDISTVDDAEESE